MRNKIFIALVATILAVLIHGYLTAKYYPLHLGLATGQSLCNVNAKLDCDTVSASPYSALFGIPLAAFGAVYNLVLFIMTLMTWLGMRGSQPSVWRQPFWLATGSVLATVVMGSISTFLLNSFCLFCIFTYVFSLVAFGALWSAQPAPPFSSLKEDMVAWFTTEKAFLGWLAAIPIGAALVHTGMMQNYGADALDRVVRNAVTDWQNSPTVEFTATPSLTKGASVDAAKMVINEFADFRCGHCKQAAPSLAAFVRANPDVRLNFYSFPLDGTCNADIERGDGISCQLAKAVFCAARQEQEKGWEVHDLIFEHQSHFQSITSLTTVNSELEGKTKDLGLEWTAMRACLEDPATHDAIKAQAEQGIRARVHGTPTVFVNGRKLERGQLLPVLSAVRKQIVGD